MASALRTRIFEAGLHLPKILTLAITDDCNLCCAHCWVEARPRVAPTRFPRMTVRRLIEEFVKLGGKGIRLTGGEPLLHPNWLEFVEFAFSSGLTMVELQTNALLLDDAGVLALTKFRNAGLILQISLDGIESATHDRVRGEGAFKGTLINIRRLASAGLTENMSFAFTEMSHNLDEFPKILALAAELGVGSVVSGTLVTGGRAAAGPGTVTPPTPGQYRALLDRYRRDVRFQDLYTTFGTMAALEWWLADFSPPPPCSSLIENLYITSQGLLYPCLLCHCDDFSVSGLFQRSLTSALSEGIGRWSDLQQWARRRAAFIPDCQVCSEKTTCSGGCIGRALGSGGDLLATDDRCVLRRMLRREARFDENIDAL